jgi:hypothetical protein
VVTYVTTCRFDGAYEVNAWFCERFDREHCDQFNWTSVDQIAHLLAIIIGSAMVHNILVKCWPPIFSNQNFRMVMSTKKWPPPTPSCISWRITGIPS